MRTLVKGAEGFSSVVFVASFDSAVGGPDSAVPVLVHQWEMADILAAFERGTTVTIGAAAYPMSPEESWIIVAATTDENTVRFIADCNDGSGAYWRARFGDGAVATFVDLVPLTGSELRVALGLSATPESAPTFIPPAEGVDRIDPIPTIVPDGEERQVMFSYPHDPLGLHVVCLHTSAGWSGCVSTAVEPSGLQPQLAWAQGDEPVEVWVLDASADTSAPIAQVASLHEEAFSNGQVPVVEVFFDADAP
ncbi:MAG TPA: hypothetical protein VNQ73_16370 [Ilumatobacter sp.]|nr:hypothetical protein [Ilumatobacter sp.]